MISTRKFATFPQEQGFSLLELVVASSIVAIVTMMGISQFRNVTARGGTEGLALQVTEDLRLAAQRAIATNAQVAVVFPTANGAQPITSGYYFLEGCNSPQVTRKQEVSSAYPGMAIFVGTWPSTHGFSSPPAQPGNAWSSFSIANWTQLPTSAPPVPVSHQKDNFFVFQPDGTVITNGQKILNADGCYHVVVAAGASFSVTGLALTHAGQCWTIAISPLGAITAVGGLTDSNAGVAVAGEMTNQAPPSLAAPMAAVPIVAATPAAINSAPLVQPAPNPLITVPGGSDGSMYLGQVASLYMAAASNSSLPLFVDWQQQTPVVNPPGSTTVVTRGKGKFSFPTGGGRMMFDATQNAYVSYWQWTPPLDAQFGDEFTLGCVVSNDPSGTVQIAIKRHITILPPGHILFESNRTDAGSPGPGGAGIFSMNLDGSPPKPRLFLPGYLQPSATPDESRIVCINSTSNDVFMCTPFSAPLPMTTSGGPYTIPAISSNGNQIAFMDGIHSATDFGQHTIYVVKAAQGEPIKTIVTGLTPDQNLVNSTYGPTRSKLSWSSNGQTLYFTDGTGISSITYNSASGTWGAVTPVVQGAAGADVHGGPSMGFAPNAMLFWEDDNYDGGASKWDPYLCALPQSALAGDPSWSTGSPGSIAGSWYHWSDLQDEALVERDPTGLTTTVLENYLATAAKPVFGNNLQIVSVSAVPATIGPGTATAGPPTSGAFPPNYPVTGGCFPTGMTILTNSPGGSYCMRPVWTK